jgi:hypothetical protein
MAETKNESPYKIGRLEITKKNINNKQILFIVDCDKSFCNICNNDSCAFDYFLKNNKNKANILINEIYKYEANKNPDIIREHQDKKKVVAKSIQNCVGYDGHYDYLFKGDKLISIKYDAYWENKK